MKRSKTPVPGHMSNASSRAAYDGRELLSVAMRPGAMDAYALPSRYGNNYVHYRTGQVIEQKDSTQK